MSVKFITAHCVDISEYNAVDKVSHDASPGAHGSDVSLNNCGNKKINSVLIYFVVPDRMQRSWIEMDCDLTIELALLSHQRDCELRS